MINDSGFPFNTSSISFAMSLLVAPGNFKTSTFFDLDNPRALILFSMEFPITTTVFDVLLFDVLLIDLFSGSHQLYHYC